MPDASFYIFKRTRKQGVGFVLIAGQKCLKRLYFLLMIILIQKTIKNISAG